MTRRLRPFALAILLLFAGFTSLPVRGLAATQIAPRLPSTIVDPAAGNLTLSLWVSNTTIEAGFQVTALCNVSGGSGSVIAWLNITGLGAWGNSNASTSGAGNFGIGTPLFEPGNQTASCVAIDSTGTTAVAATTIHVLPTPSVRIHLSEASILPGQPLTITAEPQGGVQPWRLFWLNLPPGCPYGNITLVACTPTAQGTWTVTVSVVDAWGIYGAGGINVTVRAATLLGMASDQALIVIAGLATAGAVAAAVVLLTRRRPEMRTATPAGEPEPPAPAEGEPPNSPESEHADQTRGPPTFWKTSSPFLRRAMSLGLLVLLSAVLYAMLVLLESASPSSGSPLGLLPFVWLMGIVVAAVAWRIPGPVLGGTALLAGLAVYFATAQPLSSCTTDASQAAVLGVPTCGALTVAAAAAGIVAACAAGAAVAYLIRSDRAPRRQKGLEVLGTLVVSALVVAGAFTLAAPPPMPSGAGPASLPFPLPAGSAFTIPLYAYDASGHVYAWEPWPQLFVPVTAAGGAPAVLVGGWASSVSVCIYVGNANWVIALGPPMKSYYTCGTNVTFAFPLKPAGWVVQFDIANQTVGSSVVMITQSFDLVY